MFEDAKRSIASKAYYRKAVGCYKRAVHFKKEGRNVLAQPQLQRCQSLLESALWEVPENRSAHFLLTAVLLHMENYTAARREANSLLHQLSSTCGWLELNEPVLHQTIAHTCWRLEHDGDAMSHYLDSTNIYPEHPQLCLSLSELLLAARCTLSARDMSQLALTRNDSHRCKRHLTDSEHERVTCCLALALRDLGTSLDELMQQTGTLRPKAMSQVELHQRCHVLMARLRSRSCSQVSDSPPLVGSSLGGAIPARTPPPANVAQKSRSRHEPPKADTKVAKNESRREHAEPESMAQRNHARLALDSVTAVGARLIPHTTEVHSDMPAHQGMEKRVLPPNFIGHDARYGAAKPASSGYEGSPPAADPVLQKLQWSPSDQHPEILDGEISRDMTALPQRSGVAKTVALEDLMHGLLPHDHGKDGQHYWPGGETEGAPQLGVWCCLTECKQRF